MLQGRKSAEEILGLQPQRPSAEEILGIAPQRPSAEQVLGIAPQAPTQNESYYQQLKRNVGLGLEQLGQKVSDVLATGAEIGAGAVAGDFRPLLETGARFGHGVQRLATGLFGEAAMTSPEFGGTSLSNQQVAATIQTALQKESQALADIEAAQTARREAGGDIYFRGSRIANAKLNARAAQDPSLLGRIERGLPQALPYVLAGVASGGSVPALAATGAAMELNEPENIPISAGLAALPVPSARTLKSTLAPVVEKLLGRGAAQIVEAEAEPLVGGAVQQALPGFEDAIADAAGQVPQTMTRKVLGNTLEAYRLIRAAKTSGDISAPLRQGALLTLSPSQWINGNVPRAAVRMFKAFRTKDFENITRAIGEDVDGRLAQRMGLELTTQATESGLRRTEEVFLSKWADKIPVIKQSEQAYKSYLDSLRLDRFKGYKAAIDKAGLGREETESAYRAAADWINTATGRGSFGKTIDKTLPVLGEVLFAPRNVASRLQILNPMTYAQNATTAGGRVVLKQQMADLLQFAGTVAGTLQLAKLAGAEVSTDPNSSDFLKIKAGNFRYDPLAGVQQVMRLVSRVSADLNRAAHNEPPVKHDETALGIAGRFLRSKLAPVPAAFTDFIQRRTYTGQPFSAKKQLIELYAPLQWADFVDAFQAEGFRGLLKSSPGIAGIGVQRYQSTPVQSGFIDRAQPLLTEYTRFQRGIPEIRRVKNEPDDAFTTRLKVHGEALQKYGLDLVGSSDYRSATDEQKKAALDLLPRRISSALLKQGEAWQLQPRVIMADVRESQQLKQGR